MSKKKAIKVIAASAIAASSFAAVAPHNADAASSLSSQVSSAKKEMKKAQDKYFYAKSYVSTKTMDSYIKKAKDAYNKAKKAVEKSKDKNKKKYLADLKASYKYIKNAEGYRAGAHNAYLAAKSLNKEVAAIEALIAAKDLAGAQQAIDALNANIAKAEKAIKSTIYGGNSEKIVIGKYIAAVKAQSKELAEAVKVPVVESVAAVNATSVKLTGSALDKVKAEQLSVEGNKVVSVNGDAKEVTVVFENAFESGKEQTLKLSETDKVTEFKFTYTLEVKSVEVTSKRVDDDTDKQFLGFTINGGETVSAQYLVDAGYTVEFQSTDTSVFASTTTGELDENAIASGDKFAYKVVITKGDTTVESQLAEVEVLDFATFLSSISEVTVTQDDVTVNSNKVTVEDGTVTVATTKATALNGATVNSPTVTYKSSNPAVATVDATTGEITPIKPGNVTITIQGDDAKQEVALTVVSGARAAAKVTATTNSVKLLASKAKTVDLTVVDQYGDEYEGDLTVASKDDAIATGDGTVSFTDGKATATITAVAKGNVVVEVKDGSKVLSSVNVSVSDDAVVASKKIETASASADYKLDVVAGSTDKSLDIVWNQYNAGGFLIGPETNYTNDAVAGTKYTVSSSDTSVATVSVVADGTITVAALKAGSTKVLIKEGSVTRATVTIEVVNTTPTITAVNFEKAEDVTTAGALSAQVLKAEGIALSSTEYNAEIAADGTIFIDVKGTSAGFGAGDITLGALTTVYSGKAADITGLTITAGSVEATTVAAGAEGTIVARVVKDGETSAIATTTINVKVPN